MTGSLSSSRRLRSRIGRRLGLSLLALLAVSGPAGPAPRDPQADPTAELLARILEKTEAYCRRLGRVSLDFVCRERIDERQYDPPRLIGAALTSGATKHVTRVSLEYDYQLIRKGDDIEEKRTLLKEDSRPRNEPDAVLKTKLYKHKYLVFGPGGLLSEFWQPKHAYTFLGEEAVDGDESYLIEASPKEPGEPGLVYGKAWIRKKDFAIVKIEWDQRALGNFDKMRQMAEAIGHQAEPRVSVVGFYGVEKNGIRFPDRLVIHEDYRSTRGTHRVSEVTVRYEAYRFFVVETEVRY
ncbi:MAG: Outer rane lipoprotein-sorting protein [Candidatus Aminicenantes bacterium]|jgi:hypothetical protein|nr:Outer rane lipoprotein-sorting protein [Candidatus Aminicenantes bacterium]MBS1226276.1 Outer rane lipoproteinsorting protein [Candidatus Aminicenantes bacterium]